VLRPSGAGLNAVLPVASFVSPGTLITVANFGSNSLTVRDLIGTSIAVVAVNQVAQVYCVNTGSPWGTWVAQVRAASGGSSLTSRTPIDIVVSSSIPGGLNLRGRAIEMGYSDESIAYAVHCTIKSGVVVGNEVATPGLNTGAWPAGSTLFLVLESGARICGRGGNGGYYPTQLSGADGGVALRLYLNTALVSYGYIQGGGGGGGMGAVTAALQAGGGGGGGAGFGLSVGGSVRPQSTATAGQPGAPGVGGQGGAGGLVAPGTNGSGTAGGAGGGPGAAGTSVSGGGSGGAAGRAIEKYSGATLTKIVAGTIDGAEVVVP
jgi:hypothetical protein